MFKSYEGNFECFSELSTKFSFKIERKRKNDMTLGSYMMCGNYFRIFIFMISLSSDAEIEARMAKLVGRGSSTAQGELFERVIDAVTHV